MNVLSINPFLSSSFPLAVSLVIAGASGCGGSGGGGTGGEGASTATSSSATAASSNAASSSAGSGGAGTGGGGGATATSSTSASSSSSGDAGAAVTYTADAKPIYAAHCAPCHTTGDSGGVDFAAVYADTQKAPNATVTACAGITTVGACTLIRIKNGQMPKGKGCTGNPTTDAGNAACLTQAEQTTLQAWITDGEQK
jgi:hypothetical protein